MWNSLKADSLLICDEYTLWPFPLTHQDSRNTDGHEIQIQCLNFSSRVILGESLNSSSLSSFICEMEVVRTILVQRLGGPVVLIVHFCPLLELRFVGPGLPCKQQFPNTVYSTRCSFFSTACCLLSYSFDITLEVPWGDFSPLRTVNKTIKSPWSLA